MALGAQAGDYRHRDRHRSREVGLHDLERGGRIAFGTILVAQDTERDEHEVEVAEAVERGAHEGFVRCEIGGVERDRVDLRRAGGAQHCFRRLAGFGLARGEHDTRAAPRDDLADGRERDVGGSAEHQDRLHLAQRVSHARCSITILVFLRR